MRSARRPTKPFKISSTIFHCVSVFEDIVIHPNRYVKNEVSNRSFQRKLELRDFFQRPVRGAWSDFSTMANIANVNAYYNQATNTMVVPIGMLQPPLFWTRPKSLTFGAFGIVVGKWALVSPFSKIYFPTSQYYCLWRWSFSLCFVASIYFLFLWQVASCKGHEGM